MKSTFSQLKLAYQTSPLFFVLTIIGVILPTLVSANVIFFFSDSLLKVQEFGNYGLLLYTLLTIPLMCFALVPATFVAGGAGFLFGIKGFLPVFVAYNFASAISFLVIRQIQKDKVQNFLEKFPKAVEFQKRVEKDEKWILIFSRISPIGTFVLMNIVFAVSKVSFKKYFWGTMIGMTPRTFLAVLAGLSAQSIYDFISTNKLLSLENPIGLSSAILAVLAFGGLYFFIAKNFKE